MNGSNVSSRTLPLLEIMGRRESIYSFLSRVFLREVSEEFLKDIFLRTEKMSFLAESGDNDRNEFEKGLVRFKNALDQLKHEKDIGEIVKLLGREFVYTFIVKGSHPVHPYESVYLGEERLLMQRPYDDVRAIFKKAGIQRSEYCQEMEDHIGIELEFMGLLCRRFTQAWNDKQKQEARKALHLQRLFLQNHLAKWVPQFCEDVAMKTRMDFYRGIASMTRAFVTLDSEEVINLTQDLATVLRESN